MDHDLPFGYGYSQGRNKRTHAQMENDRSTSPTWSSIDRLSFSHGSRSPSHPQVSGLHLPPMQNRPSPPPPRRYLGDGMDYRRPVTLSRNERQTSYIDLTADEPGPSVPITHRGTEAPSSTRAQRPPRFAREIIDVEEESRRPIVIPESPEIEFISSRRIDPPRRPEPPPLFDSFDDDHEEDDFEIVGANELPGERRREGNYAANAFAAMMANGAFGRGVFANLQRRVAAAARPPATPPRTGGPRGRPHISVGFRGPGELDFVAVGFDMGIREQPPPPPPTYDAPEAAPEGFTRSPAEGDVLVCPNCRDELCVGETDLKKQVWIVKQCGHVYCGDCANNRWSSKQAKSKGKEKLFTTLPKPFKMCVVEGCDKKTVARQAMIQVFL